MFQTVGGYTEPRIHVNIANLRTLKEEPIEATVRVLSLLWVHSEAEDQCAILEEPGMDTEVGCISMQRNEREKKQKWGMYDYFIK